MGAGMRGWEGEVSGWEDHLWVSRGLEDNAAMFDPLNTLCIPLSVRPLSIPNVLSSMVIARRMMGNF